MIFVFSICCPLMVYSWLLFSIPFSSMNVTTTQLLNLLVSDVFQHPFFLVSSLSVVNTTIAH